MRPRHSAAAAVDRLRIAIDRGETGDKVAYPDPAAAPLGTDAEAGGNPPTAREIRAAARHQPDVRHTGPRRHEGAGLLAYVAAVAAVCVVIVGLVALG